MTPPTDGKVVLTNMRILESDKNQTEGLAQDPPAIKCPSEEPDAPKPSILSERQANIAIAQDTPVKTEYDATLPCLGPFESKCHLPKLAKFESEDSGVELPSGANSPSTPTGSEKSFVLHSRDSSCDSGVLSASSSPAAGHIIMRMCSDTVDACLCNSTNPEGCCARPVDVIQSSATSLEDAVNYSKGSNPDETFGRSQGECLEDQLGERNDTSALPTSLMGAERSSGDHSKANLASLQEIPVQGHPLRKYPTSDSLDEYMDECCRLSEVRTLDANPNAPRWDFSFP